MSAKQYFSNDPYGAGFIFYDHCEQAKLAAEVAINEARAEAVDDGWQEDPTQICWGKVIQRVTRVSAPEGFENYELQGMADPAKEIAEMRDALKEASEALSFCESAFSKSDPSSDSSYGIAWEKVESALAKIQTILKP